MKSHFLNNLAGILILRPRKASPARFKMKNQYKIGQHMNPTDRMILAKKILKKNSATAKTTLKIMGFEEIDGGLRMIDEPKW